MSDALVSAPVAITVGVAAASLIVIAGKKVSRDNDSSLTPMMGVLGAFIFAAQMINFSIPGTGSSGHIVGGILLASLLGPWAGFLTLVSVLMIQCLVFADGGLMALGCNIINMAAFSCLIGYPFIFRPVAGKKPTAARLAIASVTASVVALELGALAVTAETELSGITALPAREFLMFMLPIHLAIGICEGVATAAVLYFINKYRPALLQCNSASYSKKKSAPVKKVLIFFASAALVLAGTFSWIASSNPDGLEWSIGKVTGENEIAISDRTVAEANSVHERIAVIPDYDSRLSGIIGGVLTVLLLWTLSSVVVNRRKHLPQKVRKQ